MNLRIDRYEIVKSCHHLQHCGSANVTDAKLCCTYIHDELMMVLQTAVW